jgi:hypothetical protein
VQNIAAVMDHEVGHLLRDHAARAKALNAEPMIWNMAGDMAINDDGVKEGMPYPDGPSRALPGGGHSEGFLVPGTYGFPEWHMEEWYYERLMQQAQAAGVPSPGSGQVPQPGSAPGSGEPKPGPCSGDCGSGADGKPRPWEDPPPGTPGAAPGLSPVEGALLRSYVAKQIQEAARARGNVPGHWKTWADRILTPRVDWRRVLAGAFRATLARAMGAVDYTYAVLSRRQSAFPDVVLPSLRAPNPQVVCIVDTSGSVGDRDLAHAFSQVYRVAQAVGVGEGLTVMAVDAAVQRVKRLVGGSGLKDMGVGRGGTDMRVGIERAMQVRPRPHVIVVLTDGHTPWPNAAPAHTKVIVCLIGASVGSAPSWARVVRVETAEAAEA